MKREVLKGFTMFMLIVALALATAVISANAQASTRIVAEVPFEFVVGDQALSSGQYTLKSITKSDNALLIQSVDAKTSAIRLTNAIEPQETRTNARLVFHRYGQRYFLAEVWNGADRMGRQLMKSRQERAIERELASISSKSELAQSIYETVEVVAVFR